MSPAGAKDDRRDARVLASARRTDPHCLRRLEPTDPAIIELREWSRLDEDLTRERVRLANRMRAAVDDALGARGGRRRRGAVGTRPVAEPADAACGPTRSRGDAHQSVEAAPHPPDRRRDITRARLRAPAFKLAPGAAEAATTHVRLVAERLTLVNRHMIGSANPRLVTCPSEPRIP